MSKPSEFGLSPPVVENGSLSRSLKKPRRWRSLIAVLLLAGACALSWHWSRPSLIALGVKEIKGYDYRCFLLENETTDEAQVSVYFLRGKMQIPASHITISQSERGFRKRAEIGVGTHGAQMFSRGQPIRVRVLIAPRSSSFVDKLKRWLSAVIPVRFLYPRTDLTSEPFVP